MSPRPPVWLAAGLVALLISGTAVAQQTGSIRGVVYDRDFDVPLALARVEIVETAERVTATEDGNYVFPEVEPGTYTLVFAKEGYARQVRTDVVVNAGRLTEVDARLSGEFEEMEEFIVEDLFIGGASEAGLLRLRLDSPSLLDSISADLMSRAGASDAASALNLVTGATVQNGKFAVIRGLPDRYVNSQMNGVRLPSADEDTRAVELDQFPAAIIESLRVSKTFTPDQQGDASGGAVNVVLRSIPEETIFRITSEYSFNSQVRNRGDFLTYDGGGVSTWGRDDGGRVPQPAGMPWEGPVGVSRGDAPTDFKWSAALGGKLDLDDGVRVGGFANFFYERDSAFYDDGINDSLVQETPGQGLVPEKVQQDGPDNFKTALFDVTKGTKSVQWGGLATGGIETEHHQVAVTYLYTRTAEDTATLAEDTRGKEFFFPGHDPNVPIDPNGPPFPQNPGDPPPIPGPGSDRDDLLTAPYVRTETLEYTERTTRTLQFTGKHTLPIDEFGFGDFLRFTAPEIDWTYARSAASLVQPDKRQFGTFVLPAYFDPGIPFLGIPPSIVPPEQFPLQPAAQVTLGNLQRIFKRIDEQSEQYNVNVRFPFEQWGGEEGYLKLGIFDDRVERTFDQQTFSNMQPDGGPTSFTGGFDEHWSELFPSEGHRITASSVDVDYRGEQNISAWYVMSDLPLSSSLSVTGGFRWEDTSIEIVNFPEPDAKWFPRDATAPRDLLPGQADVDFDQSDVLPSIGFVFEPFDELTFRGSYSETVARQVFKELTPVQQQEFLGGPVFVGNPDLQMSAVENYDLRLDYRPYDGGLVSASWFRKDLTGPIEFVQRVAGITFTEPVNYPVGELSGFEFEMRQDVGRLFEGLTGLSIGANATLIDSEVTLPESEIMMFASPAIGAPMTTRDATGAPEHLYNLYFTYELEDTGTQLGLFYTVRGDTLIAGAAVSDNNFIPSIYEREYGTLNFSLTQRLGDHLRLTFKAKNLTNPRRETVYRSEFIGPDVLNTASSGGIEYSIGLSAEFTF